jgi:cell wall-active antibiotic response 4TMS protein YvqF
VNVRRDDRGFDPAALGFGIFFIVAGAVFLLERLGVFELRAAVLWPLLLIALGAALLVAAWRRPRGNV